LRDELQVGVRLRPAAAVRDQEECGAADGQRLLPSPRTAVRGLSCRYTTRMTGARVGNWYLEAEIGRGPLGIVYRARGYDDPDRRAAVKVFTATAAQDPAFVQKFSAEMLPLQRLDHANIAKFYDSRTHGGLAFAACE